jgi:hypothetical protein
MWILFIDIFFDVTPKENAKDDISGERGVHNSIEIIYGYRESRARIACFHYMCDPWHHLETTNQQVIQFEETQWTV